MNDEIFREFNVLKVQESRLAEQLEAKKEECLAELKKQDIKTIDYPFGTFSYYKRAKWEYSPDVTRLQLDVKKMKNLEEEEGNAKATYSDVFRYQQSKN